MSKTSPRNYHMDARPSADYKLKTNVVARIKEALAIAKKTGEIQILRSVRIDKDSCLDLLTLNKGNRDVMYLDVARYANLMASGNWDNEVDDLVVTEDGRLVNGQKRLWATNMCCELTKPDFFFTINIKVGQPPNIGSKMDVHRMRSLGDVLKDAGFSDVDKLRVAIIALTIRNIYYIESFGVVGTNIDTLDKMTNDDIMKWVENQKNVKLVEKFLLKHSEYKKTMVFMAKAAFATVWYILNKKNRDEAEYFMDKLAKGEDLKSKDVTDSNISLLRNRLIALDKKNGGRGGTAAADTRYRLIFHVWNSCRKNIKLEKLQPDMENWKIEKPI